MKEMQELYIQRFRNYRNQAGNISRKRLYMSMIFNITLTIYIL